jgi:hypothetical protein
LSYAPQIASVGGRAASRESDVASGDLEQRQSLVTIFGVENEAAVDVLGARMSAQPED